MLTGIAISLNPSDSARLIGIASDRIVHKSTSGARRCAAVCRWHRHQRDHAQHWHVQDLRLALAAALQEAGKDGLLIYKTRPSRIPPLDAAVVERLVALTLSEPPGETTHWIAAAVAAACSISVSSVHRIWRSHGLRPHQIRQFKLSNDPQFAAKIPDIVGLYVNPPEHAEVLSVDEKSQLQALDRTQPGLS